MGYVFKVLIVAALMAPSLGVATPVRFDFSMTITETSTMPPIAQVGDVVTGTFTFDSTTLDTNPLTEVGEYALLDMTVTYSGITESTSTGSIRVGNNFNGVTGVADEYVVRGYFGYFRPYPALIDVFVSFYDPTASLFLSDALPLTPPVTSGLTGSLLINADGVGGILPANAIESAQLSRVSTPEPGTLALLGLGLAGLGLSRRRRAH